ncbi:MAG: hypothetical protein QOF44_2905, partial [Streptomyces sp.]|nr:hypothetical protein [Streptomyces sp.]
MATSAPAASEPEATPRQRLRAWLLEGLSDMAKQQQG